jgi:hypothetical protein
MTDNNSCPLPTKWREEARQWSHPSVSNPEESKRAHVHTFKECADELDQWLATRALTLKAAQDALKDAIQDARSNADERDGYKASFEMSMADVLAQQLAADEIVEECAKAVLPELCLSEAHSYAIRQLKGKLLLSAQPNGGLTIKVNDGVWLCFQDSQGGQAAVEMLELAKKRRGIVGQIIWQWCQDRLNALSEPRK